MDALEELAARVIRALRFEGIVELEFKRDPREGRLVLLDINPRVWGWHTLARGAGVDIPYLLWRMVRGESVEPVRARPGVRWVRALTDVPMAIGAIRHGKLSPVAYLWSLRPPIECAQSSSVNASSGSAPKASTISTRMASISASVRSDVGRIRRRAVPVEPVMPRAPSDGSRSGAPDSGLVCPRRGARWRT